MDQISSATSISIPNYVSYALAALLICGIVLAVLIHFCYKGRVMRITVVKLRSSRSEYFNFSYTKYNKSNYASMVHQTVDICINNRKRTRTFNCKPEIYKKLRVGKSYSALIRFNTIVKIL